MLGEDGLLGMLDDDDAEEEMGCATTEDEDRTVSDEAVRQAVRQELGNGSLTQNMVAQQAGVSQPMLCAWLGGKQKGSGSAGKLVVRSKLVTWLRRRGVFLTQSTTPLSTSAPSSPASGWEEQNTLHPQLPSHVPGKGVPKSRAQQPPRAAAPANSKASDSSGASAKSRARSLRFNGDTDGSSRGPTKGRSRRDDDVPSGNGRIRLTAGHLHLAYVMYLEQREREGVGRSPVRANGHAHLTPGTLIHPLNTSPSLPTPVPSTRPHRSLPTSHPPPLPQPPHPIHPRERKRASV